MEYTYFENGLEIGLVLEDALSGSHSGSCDDDIAALRRVAYVAEQLDKITAEQAVKALRSYGCWDEEELADHDENLLRILWIACGNIADEQRS